MSIRVSDQLHEECKSIERERVVRRRRAPNNPQCTLPRKLYPIPSLSVLSLLATFCAESVAAKDPTAYRCDNFLCPFLASTQPSAIHVPASYASSSKVSGPLPVPKRKNDLSRRSFSNWNMPQKLPTKYLKGQDGRYRPESSWSLNGKTLTCSVGSSFRLINPRGLMSYK
jgi:hypothetical protein